jgi:hypothetical protein
MIVAKPVLELLSELEPVAAAPSPLSPESAEEPPEEIVLPMVVSDSAAIVPLTGA